MSPTPTSKPLSFKSSTPASSSDFSARHGHLSLPGRVPIATPHFVAVNSRGAVPHLSQDTMRDQTSIKGMYVAIEDFIEKATHGQTPIVYNYPAPPGDSPLRKFIALQKDALLVLGPRRIPPLPSPASSTSSSISIVTPLGFRMLEVEDYVEGVQKLRPDIVVGMGDVLFEHKPGVKRADKMGDRTLAWVEALIEGMEREETESGLTGAAVFAPILPIDREVQSWYLNALRDELSERVAGIVLYEIHSIEAVPGNLQHLPKLYVGGLDGPHKLLDAIALGIDLFTIPFVTEATEAGIALNFLFPPTSSNGSASEGNELEPLGIDLWSTEHATDLSPLRNDCVCYTCTSHHRAYLQHLLNAREMLGWVLLQIHNHHTLDVFFETVRASLRQGDFEQRKEIFQDTYQRELPVKTGQGPRVRGYTFKSEGRGEGRKNPVAWNSEMGGGREQLAESAVPDGGEDAGGLEGKGFAEKAG